VKRRALGRLITTALGVPARIEARGGLRFLDSGLCVPTIAEVRLEPQLPTDYRISTEPNPSDSDRPHLNDVVKPRDGGLSDETKLEDEREYTRDHVLREVAQRAIMNSHKDPSIDTGKARRVIGIIEQRINGSGTS